MKRLIFCVCLCLMMLALSLRQAPARSRLSAVSLVPPSGVAVIKVNWAMVRQDDRLRMIVKGNDFEKALGELSIESGEVSEWVVFSGLNNSQSGTLAMILTGSYQPQRVVSQVKSQGWAEQIYKAHKVYINPADKVWMAPLRGGMLVAGSQAGVERVIDVEMNPQTGLASKPPFNSLLARFTNSRHPISFALGLPPAYQQATEVALKIVGALISFPGSGPLGMLMGKIGFPRMMGFSINRNGPVFPVELLAMMKDETSATLISGTINLVQGINLNMLSDRMSQADKDAIKNISVTRNGALLSIKMLLRESDLPH
jgi:hypothetical protein